MATQQKTSREVDHCRPLLQGLAKILADRLYGLLLGDTDLAHFFQILAGLAEGGLVGPSVADEVEQGRAIVTLIQAQTFGLGEEGFAALGAIAVRLVPLQDTGTRAELMPFRVFGEGVASAARAEAEVGGQGPVKGLSLPRQEEVEEVGTERAGELQGDPFEVREGRALGRAVGPIETIRQIFCLPLQQMAAIFHFARCFLLCSHPWPR